MNTSIHRAPCGALALALLFAPVVSSACSTAGSANPSEPPPEAGAESIAQTADEALGILASTHSAVVNDELLGAITAPRTGDFDAMVERRFVRALVVYSGTFYFLDGGTQKAR